MSIHFTFVLTFFILISVQTGRVMITLYALQLGAQPFTVGVLAAMFAVLPTVLSWQVGRLSDRFGARWPLTLCTLAGIVGMLAPYLWPGLPSLFVTSVLYGLVNALSASPLQNLVGLQSTPEDRAKNFSNLSLIFSFTGLVGPLAAGFSFDHTGPQIACLGLALLLVLPAAMLLLKGGLLPRGTGKAQPLGGIRILVSESGLWRVLAVSSLVVAGVDIFQVYIPIYGHRLGLSASTIGIILAIYASAAFVCRIGLPSLTRRYTVERVLATSFLVGAAGFFLMPFAQEAAVLALVSFCYGLGTGCGQPLTMAMTFSNSTRGRSGEAMGLRVTVNNLTRAMSQFLFGSLSSLLGIAAVFWLNALLFASGWAISRPRGDRPKDR